jgi:hypothetical protein
MKKNSTLYFLTILAVLYLIFNYFGEGLHENTRGISMNVADAKQRKTFVAEYQSVKSRALDSVLKDNICKEIWLEKTWLHKRWGEIDISNQDYTFVIEIQGVVNNANYGYFNDKWDIQLLGTNSHDLSLYSTRNGDKYILVGSLKQTIQLDTLTFNVVRDNSTTSCGQIQFVHSNK